MGICHSCDRPHHPKTDKAQQVQPQQQERTIEHTLNCNLNNLQKNQIAKSNTLDSASAIESQTNKESNKPTNSLLHQQDQQDNLHRLATPSIIIKKHQKKQGNERKRQTQDSTNYMQNMQDLMNGCNTWEGEMVQNKKYSKILISNKCLDIQFVLPKGRAGPVVVPYIDYEQYWLK